MSRFCQYKFIKGNPISPENAVITEVAHTKWQNRFYVSHENIYHQKPQPKETLGNYKTCTDEEHKTLLDNTHIMHSEFRKEKKGRTTFNQGPL